MDGGSGATSASGTSSGGSGASSGAGGSSSGSTSTGGASGSSSGGRGSSGSGSGGTSTGSSGGGSDSGISNGDGGSSSGVTDGSSPCPPRNNVLALTFSQYPDLMAVGNSVMVNAPAYSDPYCQQGDIIVVHASPGVYLAFDAMCPHQCCFVKYTGVSPWVFQCACHGGAFDITGKSSGVLTSQPLLPFPVCSDAGGVYVTIP
jgi:nitrite reductase/ring-hydroxylating ferredoxin subunit